MEIVNVANLSESYFTKIKNILAKHNTLGKVLTWASFQSKTDFLPQIVAEVITQDEFTHDVIIPYKDFFLVFDTT